MLPLFLFFLLGIVIFINLGRFVDVTKKPVQADLIVSLGGDTHGCRLTKALELYKAGFSKSKKIIYTSTDFIYNKSLATRSRKAYLQNEGVEAENIVNVDASLVTNTMEELFFVKEYMLRYHLKSVIFVSHPTHSGRIVRLADYIAGYKNSGLSLMVASYEPAWWNREHYYTNRHAIKETGIAIIKLIYNLVKYSSPLIRYTQYSKKISSGSWEQALKRMDQ